MVSYASKGMIVMATVTWLVAAHYIGGVQMDDVAVALSRLGADAAANARQILGAL
jgi:hypothetical protein